MELTTSRLLGDVPAIEIKLSMTLGQTASKVRLPLGWRIGYDYVVYFVSGHYVLMEYGNADYQKYLSLMMLPQDKTAFPEALPEATIKELYKAVDGFE